MSYEINDDIMEDEDDKKYDWMPKASLASIFDKIKQDGIVLSKKQELVIQRVYEGENLFFTGRAGTYLHCNP